MRKILFIIMIVLSGKYGSGQQVFFNCYDTLLNRLVNDTVGGIDFYAEWQDCIKGKQLPDFSAVTVAGKKISTHQFRGKIWVMNLWFMACAPCMAELPALNRLAGEYKKKGVVFVAFGTDSKKKLIREFIPKHKFDFILVPYTKEIIQKIGQTGFPATYIIDRKGYIRAAWTGGPVDEKAATAAYLKAKPVLDELLNEK